MTVQHHHARSSDLENRNPWLRKCLEIVQDIIVLGLCLALFLAMLVKLFHLGQSLWSGTDFSAVIADILFILVLIELFRLLGHLSGRTQSFGGDDGRGGDRFNFARGAIERRDASRLAPDACVVRVHSHAWHSAALHRCSRGN